MGDFDWVRHVRRDMLKVQVCSGSPAPCPRAPPVPAKPEQGYLSKDDFWLLVMGVSLQPAALVPPHSVVLTGSPTPVEPRPITRLPVVQSSSPSSFPSESSVGQRSFGRLPHIPWWDSIPRSIIFLSLLNFEKQACCAPSANGKLVILGWLCWADNANVGV